MGDKAAKAAAIRGGPDADRGYKPGTIARSMVQGAATPFVAKGQLRVIRPYRENIMGGGEEKVRLDVVSEDEQYYIESCYAFATTALAAAESPSFHPRRTLPRAAADSGTDR